MPTTLDRLTITRVPRVDRIILEGQRRLPGAKPADALLSLAEQGLEATRPRGVRGLMLLPDVTVNLAAAEAALLDD
ncbi:MAG: hypothetical protein LBI33_02245 [Propionibacteriaceae bacterium]|jgi:hypothetical protein|nr:hypothetical protein [Propionibacteriaceae bacterium]